jgi:hypothetical protein
MNVKLLLAIAITVVLGSKSHGIHNFIQLSDCYESLQNYTVSPLCLRSFLTSSLTVPIISNCFPFPRFVFIEPLTRSRRILALIFQPFSCHVTVLRVTALNALNIIPDNFRRYTTDIFLWPMDNPILFVLEIYCPSATHSFSCYVSIFVKNKH